jgi:hypothetical protein
MLDHILDEPLWLKLWILWMVILNSASIFFLRRAEARWTLAAWLGNLFTMNRLFEVFGYTRILGLSHVLWWTPLVVYLFRRRASFGEGAFGGWARWLALTLAASLVVDYLDVARWALGERGPA